MNWLDTQTREMLQKEHDSKLSPPKVAEFALVLLRKGVVHRRIVRAVSEINHCSEADATGLVNRPTPVTINSDLTEEEALWGQFELICSDSISVFVRSEVLEQGERAYLQSLFQAVLHSIEFSPTTVRVLRVPRTEAGAKFIDQFLGGRFPKRAAPVVLEVSFKKARMMKHWATRVGAEIQVAGDRGAEPGRMSPALPPFPVRHSRLVLLPAILNLGFAFLLWGRGIAAAGVIGAAVVPLAVLVCLYWILRDGQFYDPKREEGDPDRLISYDTKPRYYWTIVILCAVIYSGMTLLTGMAAMGEAGR